MLADEPTGNLDSISAAHVIDLLVGLQKDTEMALVLITHDENLATRCKRNINIKDNEIVEDRIRIPQPLSAPLGVSR